MKTITLFICCVLTLLLSCSKDSVNATANFSCKIDGKTYSIIGVGAYATIFSSYYTNYGTEATSTRVSNARTMYLSLENTQGVGTHAIKAKTLAPFKDVEDISFKQILILQSPTKKNY